MLTKQIQDDYEILMHYNCAERILHAANITYNLGIREADLKLVSGLGTGMNIGTVCGAIVAGTMVLSKIFVKDIAYNSDIPEIVSVFMNKTKDEYNSLECRYLQEDKGTKKPGCYQIIIKTATILESVIEEYSK